MLSPFYAQNLKRLDYSRNVLNAYADVPFLSFFFLSPLSLFGSYFDIPPTRTERKEEPIIISAPNDGVWK